MTENYSATHSVRDVLEAAGETAAARSVDDRGWSAVSVTLAS